MKLRAGLHPVSLCRLPEAVWPNGSPVVGNGKYARLGTNCDAVVPEGFVPYIPEEFSSGATETHGRSAAEKNATRVAKVRKREKARRRRLRILDVEMDAAELYQEFVGHDGILADEGMQTNPGDDEDARVFWDNLLPIPSTDRFRHCACSPRDVIYRGAKKSRLDRLGG